MSFHKTTVAIILIAGLAACGGGKSASQTASNAGTAMQNGASTAGGAMKNAAGAAGNAMQGGATAMAGGPAPVPADVNCGAVKPVWVNTSTHVYHKSTDPYYGRTKHGVYMCPSAAAAEGDRSAGGAMGKHKHGGSMQSDNGSTTQ